MLEQIAKFGGTFSPSEALVLVAAFEMAWASVEASRAPFAEPKHRERAREILATHIIEAAKSGELDARALSAGALLQLTKTPLRRPRRDS
jgi:hypothetical protein